MIKLFRTIYVLPVLLFLTLGLNGCGGGGSGGGSTTPTTSQGKFIDAAVEGITYTSGSTTGTTSADGTFTYESGKSVTFSIGGITLGTVSGSAIITPVQLVSGATNQTNATVTNIVQFLLSIDDDDNASNGIQITPAITAAAASLSIDFTSSTFDLDVSVTNAIVALTGASSTGLRGLVTESFAQSHLSDSLFSLIAGTYSGTFSGTDNGTWSVTVTTVSGSSTAVVSGSSTSSFGTFPVSGTINTSGTISASGSGTGSGGTATWTGTVNITNGTFSGTWNDLTTAVNPDGNFTGTKK